MRRWLRWLTYSYDPELHSKLDAIQARLTALPPLPVDAAARVPRLHDCGHEDSSYATDGDGTTRCRSCQDHWLAARTRNKAPLS